MVYFRGRKPVIHKIWDIVTINTLTDVFYDPKCASYIYTTIQYPKYILKNNGLCDIRQIGQNLSVFRFIFDFEIVQYLLSCMNDFTFDANHIFKNCPYYSPFI